MRRIAPLLLLLTLAGCASAPPITLFTLAPVTGAPVAGASVAAKAGPIELRRVGLAGYLDRDAIVLSAADYRLRLAHDQHWAEPLGKMLDRVLRADLAQRLPGAAIFTEAGAISATPRVTVEINVERLDADADGTVVLRAQVAVTRHRRPAITSIRLAARPSAPGTAGVVATMSGLLGQLADRVAALIVHGR